MYFWSHFGSAIKPYLIFEPAYVLFNIALSISDLADTNLYLQKSCRFNATSEPDIKQTACDDEPAGIAYVASLNSKYVFGLLVTTVLFTLLMSAWTDKAKHRRKLCILFLMVLKAVQLTGMCLHSYFWHWHVLYAVLTENILKTVITMGAASAIYICSISSSEDRTFRLTLLYVLQTITNIISSGSSGFLLRHIGFLNTYILCTVLTISAIIYVQIFVEDVAIEKSGLLKYVRDFFDVGFLVRAFKMVFRKREDNARTIISLLMVVHNLVWFTFVGEISVLYLYLRFKFGWNEQDYGLYILYKMIGISIGSVICIGLNKILKINDSAIATLAAFWDILASLGYFFAVENWQLYLIPILDIFHGFALNACDSVQSKFFESHEFGRLFSVDLTLNIAIPFAFPAYNVLFEKTMNYLPGSVFLLSSSINLLGCILYGIVYMLVKSQSKKDEEKK